MVDSVLGDHGDDAAGAAEEESSIVVDLVIILGHQMGKRNVKDIQVKAEVAILKDVQVRIFLINNFKLLAHLVPKNCALYRQFCHLLKATEERVTHSNRPGNSRKLEEFGIYLHFLRVTRYAILV